MYRPSYLMSTLCAVMLLSTTAVAAGDVAKGKRVFNKCKACHVVHQEKNRIGPHLVELFGRKAGTVEKFKYSKAMKNSGIIWDEKTLDAYLKKPRSFMKGTRMAFAGLKKDKDRENIIAYLKEATQPKKSSILLDRAREPAGISQRRSLQSLVRLRPEVQVGPHLPQ